MSNNDKRMRQPVPKGLEVLEAAAARPGGDPVGVKIVRGSLTFDLAGYGGNVAKIGAVGDDEPAVTPTVAALNAATSARLAKLGWTARFSALAFYLHFEGAGAASSATVEVWRRVGDHMVADGTFIAVGDHALIRDETSGGLETVYRLKNIVPDGATAITLYVAGEGLGYGE